MERQREIRICSKHGETEFALEKSGRKHIRLLTLNYKIMHSFGAYIVGAIVLVVLYYIFKDSTI